MAITHEVVDEKDGRDIPWTWAVLHVDMDAFFANVHILDRPEDTGIPLVVGGRPDQRGVVASASYEARKYGIRSAMPTSTAVRKCPSLKIVRANWERIKTCSRQVMELLAEYGNVEQMSVDEAYVDLSGRPDSDVVACRIRSRIKAETQLPCSVGLATSKLVAKVASDYEKPEGCTIVMPGEEARFLAPMPTRVLWGIGPRTAERLASMGIDTCGQLANTDLGRLQGAFGRQAKGLRERARGKDERRVQPERGLAKSISQEWTFSKDVTDPNLLKTQLRKMSESVAKALQARNLIAYTVRVKFRWDDFTTFTRQRTIDIGTDNADAICQLATSIWRDNWPSGQPMRLIGVGVSKIEAPVGRQLDLGL
jgi:DNA polymerase-4